MLEETWWDSVELVACENEGCGGLSFEQELEENDWKCTHCGEPISKPKRSTTDTPDRLPREKTVKEMQDAIDKLEMESRAKTVPKMPSKKSRKKLIKEIRKELDELSEEYIKMELRPCRGDADLRQKEKDLKILEAEIRKVEKDLDKRLYVP